MIEMIPNVLVCKKGYYFTIKNKKNEEEML